MVVFILMMHCIKKAPPNSYLPLRTINPCATELFAIMFYSFEAENC